MRLWHCASVFHTLAQSAICPLVLAPEPANLRKLFGEMLSCFSPTTMRTPRLSWVHSTCGSGGVASPYQIILGAMDLREIAQRVLASLPMLTPLDEMACRLYRPDIRLFTPDDVYHAVVRVVLAHELGHVFRFQNVPQRSVIEEEALADQLAGQIAECLGSDAVADRLVMQAVGCTEVVCSHPNPRARVAAYDTGRARVRALSA